MIKEISITTNMISQKELTSDLIEKFPDGIYRIATGEITAFKIGGTNSDFKIQLVIDYLKSKGYELSSNCLNYSTQVSVSYKTICEKRDLETAPYLNFYSKKHPSKGHAYLNRGRVKINFTVPKFRYCLSHIITLTTAEIGERLKKQGFKGLTLLPVDYLEGLKDYKWEEYEKNHKAKTLKDVVALYSSVQLPPVFKRSPNHEDIYKRHQLPEKGCFDIAIQNQPFSKESQIHLLAVSQQFYQFWEKNFGDAEWYPAQIAD